MQTHSKSMIQTKKYISEYDLTTGKLNTKIKHENISNICIRLKKGHAY